MTRRAITFCAAAAAFSLSLAPALAGQSKERPAGSSSTGSAVSRPSGGGSEGSSRPSGGSSSGSGSSVSSSSSRPSDDSGSRSNGDRAATRSERSRSSARASANDSGTQRRAVPVNSRSRGDRRVTGEAVNRSIAPNTGSSNVIWYPYYDPFYGYGFRSRYYYGNYYDPWFTGYGFGLGYFYDPWGYSYYSPYDYPYGYSGYGGYGGYARRYSQNAEFGQLRLKVKPEHAQVYVDGYYAGDVDSFDGVMQRLTIEAGAHRVEIRAPGYQTEAFDVKVMPGETVTYKGDLRRVNR